MDIKVVLVEKKIGRGSGDNKAKAKPKAYTIKRL